jgi:DNA-binding NarL/FixJ family response regulator
MELNTQRLFPHELSDREQRICLLLKEGKTYKEIARDLTSKETEVREWLRRLRKAFRAKNSVHLMATILENGYLKAND